MEFKNETPFAPEQVYHVLLQRGLITDMQRRDIQAKKDRIQGRIETQRKQEAASGARISNPVTIVDIITALNMKRADAPDKILDEETIFQALSAVWKVPYRKIDPLKLDLDLVTTTIPHTFAMKHLVLPIGIEGGNLIVATPNPFDRELMEDIARASQLKVQSVVSTKSDIIRLINEFFGFKRSIAAAETQFGGPSIDLGNLEQYVRLRASGELPSTDQHIVNAVDHLLGYAFDQRSSDIHIEPKREKSLVRLRIDGMLHTVYELPIKVHSAIISRVKTLARMDMAEKRRPQDGRIKMEKGGVEAEIRVSSVPVAFGEKLVLRIMDPEILFQDLELLGMGASDLLRYRQFISMPNGIVLVCGPTGSGKSTTLYSTLRYLSSTSINITTVEDPIEMVHEQFNQIAVQPAIGVTFGSILRNILRQDPDIIMIGELRDLETAQNAIQAALTGHLVLSTLHTNDAPSSITRLLDLGIPFFLVQATVVGVVSQRLVRTICPHCLESFQIESSELVSLGLDLGKSGKVSLRHGKGCLKCRGTGYFGRSGIFEILPLSDRLKREISPVCDTEKIRSLAKEEGMVTLRENAVRILLEGKTTYDEVLRVTWEQA